MCFVLRDKAGRQPSRGVLGREKPSTGSQGKLRIMVQSAKVGADGLLRVGVVGVGVMGSNHARVFADLPGVTLAGVADPDRKQREFVCGALGCPGYVDVDGLLAAGVD